MKNIVKSISALLVLLLATNLKSNAAVIPAKQLFSSPNLYSVKMNPSSRYIAKHHFRGKEYDVIEIFDIENNHSSDAFRLKVVKYAYIQDYDWVDEDTLYIAYRHKKNVYKRVFIDLDYERLKYKGEKISTAHYFDSDAYVIDTLRFEDDKLLVSKVVEDKLVVYFAKTKHLIEDKFRKQNQFSKHLEGALGYFTGSNGKIQFSGTIEGENLKFWYLEDYDSEWKVLFEFGEFDFKFEPVQILPQGKMVVLTNKDTDKVVLQEFNYLTKKFGDILYQHERYDLSGAMVLPESGLVESVSYYHHGNLTKEFFIQKERLLSELFKQKFPDKQVTIHSRENNSDKMILFVNSPTDPGEFFWFNQKSNMAESLGLRFQKFEGVKFSDTKNFKVKSKNDVEIEAILTIPNKPNGTLLVSPHGGPIGVRNIDTYSSSNQFYASRGYAVLNINFRGSHGYGKKFLSEGTGQFGQIIEQDISLVVDQVLKNYNYQNICAVGSSYGGYSSVILATYHPETYDCAVGAYGIYDLPLLFNTSNIQMSERKIKAISNTVGDYNPSMKLYSPVYFAEKVQSPVLLIAGKSDSISGFEQSNRMAYRLRQLEKPVETLFYEDTGHGHDSFFWERHEHIATEEFIRRQLKLKPLAKADQKIIDQESILLADSYNFDDKVEDNQKRAFELYRKAARGDEPRATYNLANYYVRGDFVEKDIGKALKLFEKSARLGFAEAHYKLGWIYLDEKYNRQDFHKARKSFNEALLLDYDKAEHQIGRIDCLKIKSEQSLLSCNQFIEKLIKADNENVLDLFHEILFSDNLEADQLETTIGFVEKAGLTPIKPDTVVNLEDYGSYYLKYWKYKNSSSSTNLTLESNEILGLTIEIEDENDSSSDVYIFKEVWHHPDFNAGDEKESEAETKSNFLTRVGVNKEVYIFFKFKDKNMRKPGVWTVELQDLKGNTFLTKSFNVEFELD